MHLREDIRAAELLSSVKRRHNVEPPSVELVTEVRALEAAVVTGAVFAESAGTGQKSDDAQSDVAALWATFAEARRAPSQSQSLGRETLRLRVQPEIRSLYRGVERLYLRHRPRAQRAREGGGGSGREASRGGLRPPVNRCFFQFACLTFIETWIRALPPVAYADIYARDGLRCTNPFCARRDCTPHHTRYRAHGGGNEPENLTTLCTWCHLEGVHGGRISVRGSAPDGLEWRLGGHTTVIGRDRNRAA